MACVWRTRGGGRSKEVWVRGQETDTSPQAPIPQSRALAGESLERAGTEGKGPSPQRRARLQAGLLPPIPRREDVSVDTEQGERQGWMQQCQGPGAHLVCNVDVHVLTEGVALGEPRGTVLDQVEGLERPERCQQLFYLRRGRNSVRAGLGKDWEGRSQEEARGLPGHRSGNWVSPR